MKVPDMGERLCFLFWADVHYFAAMSTCLFLRGQRTASVSCSQEHSFSLTCSFLLSYNGRLLFPAVRNSMEEENVSLILNGKTSVAEEFSDSNSSTQPFPASKRARSGSNGSASILGVVLPLPNGHWGCQIYANHQRIWLGTFKSEKEEALANDSAAIKILSGDSRRNFPLTDVTVEEPKFQIYYSTELVLKMIKDGTYQCKFADLQGHAPEVLRLNSALSL